MKGLSGDFESMPLKDLTLYLFNRQQSGLLVLENDVGTRKSIWISSGSVVNTSSNVPREYLGQFLINLGHITEEQFHQAYETQRQTNVFFGQILVMIGLVPEQTVKMVLELKFRETILEAFFWADGFFEFDPTVTPPKQEGLSISLPLLDIHREFDFREVAWMQIRSVFPSGDCLLTLKRENLATPVEHGSLDEKMFAAIESQKSINEIALLLHANDFFLYQRLFALHRLDAIECQPPKSNASSLAGIHLGDSPSADQVLHNARTFFEQRKYRDAYELCKSAAAAGGGLQAKKLLREVEMAWTPQLRTELLGASKKLKLAVSEGELAKLSLTAQERYLLSRLDGSRDIDAIVRIAPLSDFDSLSAFDRFAARGLVRFVNGKK
jgi:Domain of unknown function (DUF4388)